MNYKETSSVLFKCSNKVLNMIFDVLRAGLFLLNSRREPLKSQTSRPSRFKSFRQDHISLRYLVTLTINCEFPSSLISLNSKSVVKLW